MTLVQSYARILNVNDLEAALVGSMHPDEIALEAPEVRRLLSQQFPYWSDLPIERVTSSGTVNAMFRLGNDMTVRLPFVEWGASGIEHETVWLPRLAPQLPVRIPAVLGAGKPDDTYPCPWLVLDWLPGESPIPGELQNPDLLAGDLATFMMALREADTTAAPQGYRGGALEALDEPVRDCLRQVEDLVDVAALTRSWEDSLRAEPWTDEPVWVHCDLLTGNVLVADGRLVGVLDFAASGIGDPACDLMAAWSILPASSRGTFRDAVGIDDATWARGRGWALSQAVIALPYYRETNRIMAANSLHILTELARATP
ncbi:MAG: phosphotransferase [Microbacteriaceae bacterium]|nr:phosphotransferase [Microbacteriaceae bacterium]